LKEEIERAERLEDEMRERSLRRQLEELWAEEAEARRLAAGSRFNISYEHRLTADDMTPESVMAALSEYVDFTQENVEPFEEPLPKGSKLSGIQTTAPCAQSVEGSTNSVDISGIWKGTGRQNDGSTWSVSMRIDRNWATASSDETIGVVDYLSLQCGGLIIKCPGRFLERLTYGKDHCVDGRTISVARDGHRLTLKWYYPDGRLGAEALLAPRE
jgi:hypothetical protein